MTMKKAIKMRSSITHKNIRGRHSHSLEQNRCRFDYKIAHQWNDRYIRVDCIDRLRLHINHRNHKTVPNKINFFETGWSYQG